MLFTNPGWSLMHYAALHGSSEVINSLVKAGAKVNVKDLADGELHILHSFFSIINNA